MGGMMGGYNSRKYVFMIFKFIIFKVQSSKFCNSFDREYFKFLKFQIAQWGHVGSYGRSYGSMRKPAEALRKPCGSPAEALRKPCGSPAEALRKSYGNFSKIEKLKKNKKKKKKKISKIKICGSMRKPAEALRKLPHASACFRMLPQENKQKVRKIIEFFSAEAIFTLRKPCGRPAEVLLRAFSKIGLSAEASAGSYI